MKLSGAIPIGLKMKPFSKRGVNTSLIISNNCAIVEVGGGSQKTKSVFFKGKSDPPSCFRRRFDCGDELVSEGNGIVPPPNVMFSLSAAHTRRLVKMLRTREKSLILFWGVRSCVGVGKEGNSVIV